MLKIENKESLWSRRKVRLNPHVESHGHRALEWSYHFPLEKGLIVEGELDVAFAGGKVSGSARDALSRANLVNTRLSLADVAEDIGPVSLKLLSDIQWISSYFFSKNHVSEITYSDPNVRNIPKYLKHRAKEYWSETLFSKLALFLQSEMKAEAKILMKFFSNVDVTKGVDKERYAVLKRKLLSVLRAVVRFVEIQNEWSKLPKLEPEAPVQNSNAAFTKVHVSAKNLFIPFAKVANFQSTDNSAAEFEYFQKEVYMLAEFSLIVICKYLAEIQESLIATQKKCVEAQLLVFENSGTVSLTKDITKSKISEALELLNREVRFFKQWANLLFEFRDKCGLNSLAEISLDPGIASRYFERVHEIKRHYYNSWDIKTNLNPNDSRIDFWVGGIAAAVAAFVAFFGTFYLRNFFPSFSQSVSLQEASLIALVSFSVATTILYVIKDRVKEMIKQKVKRIVATGQWSGMGTFAMNESEKEASSVNIARIKRQAWWKKLKENWHFHIWEKFEIHDDIDSIPATIAKHVWRLPLDEILDTLDDSHHIIKLPAVEGDPQKIPVLKRVVFPYKVAVTVKTRQKLKKIVRDQVRIAGNIVVLGGKIVEVK